jgi:ABC-type enterobactin transport system permease subunit
MKRASAEAEKERSGRVAQAKYGRLPAMAAQELRSVLPALCLVSRESLEPLEMGAATVRTLGCSNPCLSRKEAITIFTVAGTEKSSCVHGHGGAAY